MNELPLGNVSPTPALLGRPPCRMELSRRTIVKLLNDAQSASDESTYSMAPAIARLLCDDSIAYETQWVEGSRDTRRISFWWRVDDRGFPNYPDAKYALFLYLESDETSGPMDIACALLRILKAVDYEYSKAVVLGFAHAVTLSGTFAVVLFDEGGWEVRRLDFHLDEPSWGGTPQPPVYHGYHVVARPRSFIKNLDTKLYENLMAVRLYLIDRRALHPTLYPILGRRYEPFVEESGEVRGSDSHF
ncbi:hypothetical protein PENSPDRAFT_694034 [Peniophora sp. CONT]|nr:hypothetical protein PENSPDRAFT_694034 [Peniophora sp. CONT]